MKRLWLIGLFLLLPCAVQAQTVANPSAVDFTSPDQTTVIPAGQTNAGQPTIASYQGMLFKVADDPTSGVPVVVGPVVVKTAVVAQPGQGPNIYRLTFAQMGTPPPACTTLPCPQFTLVLVAIGPNGTSARAVASESVPFTAAVPVVGPAPAGPTNLKLVP